MKKIFNPVTPGRKMMTDKFILNMKVSFYFILISVMNVSATVYSQDTKINLKLDNTNLIGFFEQLQENTKYDVFYQNEQIPAAIHINADYKNKSITSILNEVLTKTDLDYKILDSYIVISSKMKDGFKARAQAMLKGTVTDTEGNPLPGVNILIKGTTTGSLSDFDGNFSIKALEGDILEFSYVGMETLEVTIGAQNNIKVQMIDAASELDEVIVVGYGTQKKSSVSGSITSVQAAELVKTPVVNTTELLAGRMAGLITKQTSGTPGNDNTSINIRGFGTAMVILDGIQISAGEMGRLDPNEIESISVLKDASAAVYGSRAGNGVVLVTTKRGKTGKAKISYSGSTSFQTPTKSRNYVDSWEYATLLRDADLVDSYTQDSGYVLDEINNTYTSEDVEKFKLGNDPNYVNEDWNAAVFKNWTPMTQHNLNVRGGNDKVKYFASIGFLDQESAYKSGDLNFDRYNVRTNLDAQINKNLTFAIDLSYRRENRDSPGTNVSTMYNLLQTAQPVYPANLPDADRAAYSGFTTRSPYAATQKKFGGFNDDIREYFNGKMELKYKFNFGLTANATMNYQTRNTSNKQLRKPFKIWSYDYDSEDYTDLGTYSARSSITETYNKRIVLLPSFSLEYEKQFGEHNIKALALIETTNTSLEQISAKRFDLISTDIPYLSSGHPETQENDSRAFNGGRKSYVGRINYNYQNKYFLEGTMRADATGERFGAADRWGYFPSVSGAWRISEENFAEQFDAMNNLKLRVSYSQTGLDNYTDSNGNPEYFRYLSGYEILDAIYLIDDGSGQRIRTTGLANPQVTWLNNNLYNVGLDGSFWNGLLGFELDVFYRETIGRFGLPNETVPTTFGANLPQVNINNTDDRGFDIVINHRNTINDDLNYSISANVGWARSKWTKFSESEFTDPNDIRLKQNEGRYRNRIIGYLSDGMFMTQEEIDNHTVNQDGNLDNPNSTLRPGDIRYKDRSGDGFIGEEDREDIGYGSTPDISYGLNLKVNYKNFSVSALFQGAGLFNMDITGAARGGFSNQSTPYDYQLKYRWTPDPNNPGQNTNPDVRLPRISNNGVSTNNNKKSDFWLLDNTYLRLKSLNLNYSVDSELISKMGLGSLDLFASGTNLLSFNRMGIYKDTFDVEGPTNQGGRSYPIMKTITFGVRISL